MLVNTNASKEVGDLVCFMLTTGQEIIGKIESIGEESYMIEKPFQFQMSSQGMGIMPFSFVMDTERPLEVFKNNIVASSVPSKEVSDSYLQASSGIKLASGNISAG